MKFTAAYYLLLLYTIAIVRPVVPVISDFFSHTFYEAIHVGTVHAKLGSNHAHELMAKETAENNGNKSEQAKNLQDFEQFHIGNNLHKNIYSFVVLSTENADGRKAFLPSTLIARFIPPPRF